MKKIIAIAARKGRGKDTAALYLAAHYGFVVDHFAAPLRSVVATIFGVSMEEMNDPVLKETTLTRWPFEAPGRLLQIVGTDLIRERWPDAWTRAAMRRAGDRDRVVLADCRFPNEGTAVRDAGGVVIRLTGPCRIAEGARDPNHPSETQVDYVLYDFEIANDGSFDDLYAHLDAVMIEMGIPKIECWTPAGVVR